jgi:hypothetical protein
MTRVTARVRGFIGCWMLLLFAVSVCAQNSNNALPPLAPVYPEIRPAFWEQHGMAALMGLVIFCALAAVVLWAVFRPSPARVLPLAKIARDALLRLQSQPEDGQLLSQVSQVLRSYVGAVSGFPGAEMTTTEFCANLSQNRRIEPELSGAIATFLRECDVRKFARIGSAAPVNAASQALELVEKIHRQTGAANQGGAES